jgi:hypothetical protein
MPTVHDPLLRRQYPGLREDESNLLRAYLQERDLESVARLRTQVKVGAGEDVPTLPEPYRKAAKDLSRWKIDAVIDWPGSTELIELKSRATHTAAGQLVGYSNQMRTIPEERSSFTLTIVAYRHHPDLLDGLRGTGIRVHTIPREDPTDASR